MSRVNKEAGKRIRKIRESEKLGRQKFSELTEINKETLIKIEQGKNEPSFSSLEKILGKYPKYSAWLMTGQIKEGRFQTKPIIRDEREEDEDEDEIVKTGSD